MLTVFHQTEWHDFPSDILIGTGVALGFLWDHSIGRKVCILEVSAVAAIVGEVSVSIRRRNLSSEDHFFIKPSHLPYGYVKKNSLRSFVDHPGEVIDWRRLDT